MKIAKFEIAFNAGHKCTPPMKNTGDEVCSLLKIYHYDFFNNTLKRKQFGPVRESNPGPLAPEARIMPLDQQAKRDRMLFDKVVNNV